MKDDGRGRSIHSFASTPRRFPPSFSLSLTVIQRPRRTRGAPPPPASPPPPKKAKTDAAMTAPLAEATKLADAFKVRAGGGERACECV